MPRITVRRLMVLAALVALAFGGWREVGRLRRLSLDYSIDACLYGLAERLARANGAQGHEDWLARCRVIDRLNAEGGVPPDRLNVILFPSPPPAVQRERADYYGRMRAKYERAARYPWLPVPPDPPEPRWSP